MKVASNSKFPPLFQLLTFGHTGQGPGSCDSLTVARASEFHLRSRRDDRDQGLAPHPDPPSQSKQRRTAALGTVLHPPRSPKATPTRQACPSLIPSCPTPLGYSLNSTPFLKTAPAKRRLPSGSAGRLQPGPPGCPRAPAHWDPPSSGREAGAGRGKGPNPEITRMWSPRAHAQCPSDKLAATTRPWSSSPLR